jgi:predicted ATPase
LPLRLYNQRELRQHRRLNPAKPQIYTRYHSFFGPGLPDVLAYMHYIGDSYPAFFDAACRENIYSKIFVLPPWEEIYESDEARYENYEQAKLIYNHLIETYLNYGYELIEVPKYTVDKRILFILDKISR